MKTLGRALKKATGVDSPNKTTSLQSSISGGSTTKVVYRFDNKFYSASVEAEGIPEPVMKYTSDLPGSSAKV